MIFLAPACGLCNRMRAISSAYTLSVKYKTPLVVLWRMDEDCNIKFERLFRKEGFYVWNYSPAKGRYIWPLIISQRLSAHSFFSENGNNIDAIERALSEKKNIFITSNYQFFDSDNFRMLKPSQAVLNEVDKLPFSQAKENWDKMIGIHIRRTDNPWSCRCSSTEGFIDRVNRMLAEDSSYSFFLASDSREVEQELIAHFGDRIVTSQKDDYARDTERGMLFAAVDLYCLSRCTSILGSFVSSFSTTASLWRGEKPLYIVRDKEIDKESVSEEDWKLYEELNNLENN